MNAIVEQFVRLPGIGKMLAKAENEAAAESFSERQKLVDEIEQVKSKLDSELPPLAKVAKEAEREYRVAESRLAACAATWRVARQRAERVAFQSAHEAARREAVLKRTADKRIDIFVAELTEWHQATREISTSSKEENDANGRTRKRFSTMPSIVGRLQAIQAARLAAERLKIEAVADVPMALAAIRKSIPTEFPFIEIIVR